MTDPAGPPARSTPWPAFVRRRPPLPAESDYRSPLHNARTSTHIGALLAICLVTCLLTGLWSHFVQHPVDWLPLPHRPVWIYQLTQGLHVAAGLAAIPLLGIKLWVVTPRFWRRPLLGGPLRMLERGSVLVLIASVAFELISGLFNVAEFYPWTFFFPSVHYAVAFLAIGSVLVHIAVKLPAIRSALSTEPDHPGGPGITPAAEPGASAAVPEQNARGPEPAEPPAAGAVSRRGLLLIGAGAVGAVTLATVGDRIPVLQSISPLAQRGGSGPQDLPVNRTAAAAGIDATAIGSGWRLVVAGRQGALRSFTLADLQALPQVTADLPIACVEGWTRWATWTGPRIPDILSAAGAATGDVRLVSLDSGLYGVSSLPVDVVTDPLTLVALVLNGGPLDPDHGAPARLIAPGRPGALQTKWLNRIEVI